MAMDPSQDTATAPTRGRRGTTTTKRTITRRPRSASSNKAVTASRSSSRKPRGRRSGGVDGSSSNRPVRQWVQVHRPPGNNSKIQFTVQQWVPVQDLTEAEREKYAPAGARSSSTVPMDSSLLANDPSRDPDPFIAVAARKLPPRPSSVTFAMDTDDPPSTMNNEPMANVTVTMLPTSSTIESADKVKAEETPASALASNAAEQGLTALVQQPPSQEQQRQQQVLDLGTETPALVVIYPDADSTNPPKRPASPTTAAVEEPPPAKRQRTTEDSSSSTTGVGGATATEAIVDATDTAGAG